MTTPPRWPPSPATPDGSDPEDTWSVRWQPLALEQLAGGLPHTVADAAYQLITGVIAANPYRLSKPLHGPLADLRTARVGPDHRILLYLDEDTGELVIVDIDRRSRVYRTRSPTGWWRGHRRRRT